MAPAEMRRRDEALDWARRIADPEFADWEAHIAWLEASPDNAVAFDAVSIAINAACRDLAPAGPLPREAVRASANDNLPPAAAPARRRYAPWLGAGIAAGIVGLVALQPMFRGAPAPTIYSTAPGEQKNVRLADGTQVALNGDSAVRIDAADPRLATLVHGEALFSVVHNAQHPFAVRAGDATFQDVGTVFDVVRTPTRAELAVREGAVLYDPAGTRQRIEAGHALRFGGGDATLSPIAPASVGGWRTGRLTYAGAPIEEVAEDLARAIGQPVSVDKAANARSFSGVIVLDHDRTRLAKRVSAVTGLAMTPDGTGWRMALPAP